MKHTFNRLLLGAAIGALTTLPALAQTGFVDSTGMRPWQGVVQLRGGIDPSLTSGGSGATLIKPLSTGCPAFTNTSATTAVEVGLRCYNGGRPTCSAYVNGGLAYHTTIRDDRSDVMGSILVPPLASFSASGHVYMCSITALANNVTAQQLNIRWVTSQTFTWTSSTFTACTASGGYTDGYGFTTYNYNFGAPTVGGSEYRSEDAGCVNFNDGGGSN